MPSKSPEQEKLMKIAAHTPGGYGGVPQNVGREFMLADMGRKLGPIKKAPKVKRKPSP